MRTIVEPQKYVDKLWGKQCIKETSTYRLMRYVLRVDYDGKILLHNAVTGQLVVLEREECEALEKLPVAYNPVIEQLVTKHFLVPEDYNEHQQVKNLRKVLICLEKANSYSGITTYTILTTTACNARCYYCYEQGNKIVTMTEETANDIITYIVNNCGPEKKVFLTWFGGEPTLASDRITQICSGLQQKGIQYQSEIITNGYLFDEHLVSEAKEKWKLQFAQICVDGTEKNYNYIKSYVGVIDNPYERVMRNVQLLLNAGIKIKLRMNFDVGNYLDYKPLVEEVKKRFKCHPLLQVSEHPIIGAYPNREGNVVHGSDSWFEKTIIELNEIAISEGINRKSDRLPSLNHRLCIAARDYAVTITPEGSLVRCPERFDNDQITGTVREGITNQEVISSWKEIAEIEKCKNCILFPDCLFVKNCLTSGLCFYYDKRVMEISSEIIHRYHSVK